MKHPIGQTQRSYEIIGIALGPRILNIFADDMRCDERMRVHLISCQHWWDLILNMRQCQRISEPAQIFQRLEKLQTQSALFDSAAMGGMPWLLLAVALAL